MRIHIKTKRTEFIMSEQVKSGDQQMSNTPERVIMLLKAAAEAVIKIETETNE